MKIFEISCKEIFLNQDIEGLRKIPKIPVVATIGTFDGLHKGHCYFLNNLWKYLNRHKLFSLVFTFYKNPSRDASTKLLTTIEEKINYFKAHNLNYLIIIKIDSWLYKTTDLEFINFIKKYFNINTFFCTVNTTYGKNKTGSPSQLAKYFNIKLVNILKTENSINISSSFVKEQFNQNKSISYINDILGHPYFILGKIIKGHKLASTINIPTANLYVFKNKIIPSPGIYLGLIYFRNFQKYYWSAVYIGNSPTLLNLKTIRVEAHVFNNFKTKPKTDSAIDFYKMLNEVKYLTIYFFKYLSKDEKFITKQQLLAKIKSDLNKAKYHSKKIMSKYGLKNCNNSEEIDKKLLGNLFINA